MERLTEEQIIKRFGKIGLLRKNTKSTLINECDLLEIGDYLFVSRKEWVDYGYSLTTKPCNLLIYAYKKKGSPLIGKKFSIKTIGKEKRAGSSSGWLIKRIQ